MRSYLILLFLVAGAIAGGQTAVAQEPDRYFEELLKKQKAAIGKPFPTFVAKGQDTIVTNKALLGKTVFLNFWFEACAPCVAEFEGLNELYRRVQEDERVLFVTFTFESPETIKAVKEKYGLLFPVLSVSPEECRRLNLNLGFPTTMIVDKEGKITYLHVGGSTNKKAASEWVMKEYYSRLKKQLGKS